ncbi:MBL fold metallo-hydrolase [Paenibacillus sp. 481]|uniref:MBL fold metallo-hydrolase n=1 Tax=Paenibacillus sp. 481 TaxID=2835869 RepID=UPI001E6006A1|nr:MBL fold metallo-hydrolase [Paenibacillus sp. 481]
MPNQHKRNPTVDLPLPIEAIIQVDAVIVTHLHPDHFDAVATEVLSKDMQIFAQSEMDADVIKKKVFKTYNLLLMVP